MKKKTSEGKRMARKLTLHVETLRALSPTGLQQAAAGQGSDNSLYLASCGQNPWTEGCCQWH